MALKFRRGATVPALQPGEPFFDGGALHVGKLDGSGNQKIGGGGLTVDGFYELDLQNSDTVEHDLHGSVYPITQPGNWHVYGSLEETAKLFIDIPEGTMAIVILCEGVQSIQFVNAFPITPDPYTFQGPEGPFSENLQYLFVGVSLDNFPEIKDGGLPLFLEGLEAVSMPFMVTPVFEIYGRPLT